MKAFLDSAEAGRFVTTAAAFRLDGAVQAVEPLGAGLINTTARVRVAAGADAVLQRINSAVFPAPAPLMANLRRVTNHLATRAVPTLALLPTHGGADWFADAGGQAWRCFRYESHSRTWTDAPDLAVARAAAAAFGAFVAALADLPGPRLYETIPGFHDTPTRLQALGDAWAADPCGRAAGAAREVDAVLQRAATGAVLSRAARAGELPERVVHNDTKLSNVLFDTRSGAVRCVIDLDTVMPGLLAHDFGDLVRSVAAVPGPDGPRLDAARCAAVANGYLAGAGALLTPAERHYLAVAPQLITLELAARFLTDHLLGDVYFRTQHPGQNLRRARDQLALLSSMERQADALRRAVERAPPPDRGSDPGPAG